MEVLIAYEFTLIDHKYEEKVIKVEPTHSENRDQQNEVLTLGQSATQQPRAYVFEYTYNDEVKEIRIIDTPGIGDTRGFKYDKENFANILKFLADYIEIHAMCILMKPNNSRETLVFQFCIDELLVHLHKNASRNILFCFTNSRGTCYRPGYTFPTLKAHLTKLRSDREILIPLTRDTMFCFDSESFRFLCASKQNFVFTEREKEDYSISWRNSVEETARLFDRICALPVHDTNETLCLNSTRQLILALADPLANIVQTNIRNKESLMETKNKTILKIEKIEFPKTVCTSKDCVEFSRIGNGTEMKTVYKTVCHDHCCLDGVQEETVPNHILQSCACMKRTEGSITCKKCKCSWNAHMHIRYNLNKVKIQIHDKETQVELSRNGDKIRVAEIFKAKLRADISSLETQHALITQSCAEFAAFLAENSILPYNDSYLNDVNFLIKQEQNKAVINRNEGMVIQMEQYRNSYQEQVNLIKANIENKAAVARTVEEINKMLEDLKKLKYSGDLLVEVQEFEMASIRTTKLNTETRTSLSQFGKSVGRRVWSTTTTMAASGGKWMANQLAEKALDALEFSERMHLLQYQ